MPVSLASGGLQYNPHPPENQPAKASPGPKNCELGPGVPGLKTSKRLIDNCPPVIKHGPAGKSPI